jgi:hypothetical protein
LYSRYRHSGQLIESRYECVQAYMREKSA